MIALLAPGYTADSSSCSRSGRSTYYGAGDQKGEKYFSQVGNFFFFSFVSTFPLPLPTPSFPLFASPSITRGPGRPADGEAENASRPPLPCAAPRRTALAGSHHSPWWGSGTSRRRGGKVGRSAGVRDQYWTSLWADKPGRPGRNRGRSHAVGRQELLRRVHKLSMVSCGLIRASLYLLVVLCDLSCCVTFLRATYAFKCCSQSLPAAA